MPQLFITSSGKIFASEEPWEIRKTCFWLAGWKGSEKFLAESGRLDEGGKERRGGKLIGRDFGAVSLKKNKGVAHHSLNRRSDGIFRS